MKILVFGAGVLGCNLAKNLFSSGKDVTLLARGNWADEIKNNGLRIKNKFLPITSKTNIPVITELKPEDNFDVIFVVVRYTQINSIIDTLKNNSTKNIIFVGNNVRTNDIINLLPNKNVLFAFSLSAGHREQNRIVSIDLKKLTIGQLSSSPSNELLIKEILPRQNTK